MSYDKSRTHAYVQAVGAFEFACYEAACGVAYRFQSLYEKYSHARNKLHDGAHLDTQSE